MRAPHINNLVLPEWLNNQDIRPYIFIRKNNRIFHPGAIHRFANWFHQEAIVKDPLNHKEVGFANMIYSLESKAFTATSMPMPRWVFYDCAVMPGIVVGFCMKKSALPSYLSKVLDVDPKEEWVPLSLFIAIPCVTSGEWIAHNLCTVNSLIPKDKAFTGMGFLTKAFGLWYANIENLCGVTQWTNPAIKLHCNYGNFELLTGYTPIHSHAGTLTYRSWVDSRLWSHFFTKEGDNHFTKFFKKSSFIIHPNNEKSLLELQSMIEKGQGPYYLDAMEVRKKGLGEDLHLYTPIG